MPSRRPDDAAEREAHSRELRSRQVAVAERKQALAEQKQKADLAKRKNPETTAEPKERTSQPERSESSRSFTLPSFPSSDAPRGQKVIAAAWFTGIIVISWQEAKVNKRAPDPNKLAGWCVAIAILDLIAPLITWEFSEVLAVGLVIGLLIFRKPKASPTPYSGTLPGDVTSAGKGTFNIPPGGTAPNLKGSTIGSGQWHLDALQNAYQWVHWYTAAELKAANMNTPAAPGKSPPWRWDPSANQWIDTTKLPDSPTYNPQKAPTLVPGGSGRGNPPA